MRLDLIECGAYVTGGNLCSFDKYPIETFMDMGFGIAEIEKDGTFTITKDPTLGGFVNNETVRSQLLYELQGNIYLNSDVKVDLHNVIVKETGIDRYA